MTLDEALKRLEQARKKLDEDQGRVARSNARGRFLRALRQARAAVDAEYPVIPKKVTKRRKPNPKRAVREKAEIRLNDHRLLLTAGVKPHHFIMRGATSTLGERVYAPRWMAKLLNAGFSHADIASAVRSRPKRRKMLTFVKLGGTKRKRKKKS